jgi:hypothetical protein
VGRLSLALIHGGEEVIMENNVVSLETAWKLLESDFPQDTEFCWSEYDGDPFETPDGPRGHWGIFHTDGPSENCPAAPTAQEIADELPESMDTGTSKMKRHAVLEVKASSEGYVAGYVGFMFLPGRTMAEALAALWLKLHEKDHE